jgi:hypothetical protein
VASPLGGEGDAAWILRVLNGEHDTAGTLAEDVNHIKAMLLVRRVPKGGDDWERHTRLRIGMVHKGLTSVKKCEMSSGG